MSLLQPLPFARYSIAVTLCVLILPSFSPPAPRAESLDDIYLFGAHVYRVPPPHLPDVFDDMAVMNRLGMNLANIQETWAWDNSREGEYDFSNLIAIVEEARRLGLKASVTVTLEVAPKWVWDKYPDARLLNAYNQPYEDPTQYVMPADGKPGPCWDHEGVKREAETFLHEIAEAMQPYENMVYWNVWQEAHLWSIRPNTSPLERLMPYNPETLHNFRIHLREKYETLDGLNIAWKTRYGAWDEVDPPRAYLSVPSFIDWSRYIHEGYLAGTLEWRRKVLRDADSLQRPVAAHTATPYFGTTCEFDWSKRLDFYGTSFYPTVSVHRNWESQSGLMEEGFSRYQELWSSLFHVNYSRCATGPGPRFMLHEMACGPYNDAFTVRGDVSAADLRRWLLLQLAAGSQGAVVWNTRSELFWNEAQGQGFLDGDGQTTPRAKSLEAFGEAIRKHGPLMARSVKPVPLVAIYQDENLFRFAMGSSQTGLVVESVRGSYKACFDAGVDVDIIDGDRTGAESLAAYRVVIHPFPALISDAVARKLQTYVERGGTLISGPVPGRFDESGFARYGLMSPAVESLFGVRHETLRQVAEFEGRKRWTPDERRYGDLVPPTRLTGVGPFEGFEPKAALYLQTFEAGSAKPTLLWNDRVVGVANDQGKGTAYLFGTHLIFSILGEKCDASQRIFERILKAAGVEREAERLLLCRRVWKTEELLFAFNPTGKTQEWEPGPAYPETFTELLGETRVDARSPIPIPPYDLRAFVMRRVIEKAEKGTRPR